MVWVGGGLGEWGEPGNPPSDPLEDPVLSSYVKCISADMLCVWRRVVAPTSRSPGDMFDQLGLTGPPPPPPQMSHHPPLSLAAAKELWIFWYGEEPDLSSLVAPELLSAGKYLFFLITQFFQYYPAYIYRVIYVLIFFALLLLFISVYLWIVKLKFDLF